MGQPNENNDDVVGNTRPKVTDIEHTLPPIAELVDDETNTSLRYTDLDGAQAKLEFRPLVADDPMPLPMPVDREGYCSLKNTPRYWATGMSDWLNVQEAMKRFTQDDEAGAKRRVLDFGCATGRFLRHVWRDRDEMNLDIWGCDYSPQNVDWAQRYLHQDIKIRLNTDQPGLPFPDAHFDLVTAFSVFTHIDQFETEWLLELRRITKPNGILYLTIQNQATWSIVPKRVHAMKHLLGATSADGDWEITSETFDQPFPFPRVAVSLNTTDVYGDNVWMTNEFVREQWGRFFEVLHIADLGHTSYQSPVIMRPLA